MTIFEIVHHVAICFVRTGVKSLTTMRRTLHKNGHENSRINRQENATENGNVVRKTQSTTVRDNVNEDAIRQCKSPNGLNNKQQNNDWLTKVIIFKKNV